MKIQCCKRCIDSRLTPHDRTRLGPFHLRVVRWRYGMEIVMQAAIASADR